MPEAKIGKGLCVSQLSSSGSEEATHAQLGFIPKMWQPSFLDVPQIPYTFAPRQTHGAPGKRHGRKGKAGNASSAAGATAPIYASYSISCKSRTGSWCMPGYSLSRHMCNSNCAKVGTARACCRCPCTLLTKTHAACHADSGLMHCLAGQIIDWDPRLPAAGGSEAAFSAAKYAELLSEDI